MDKRKLIIIGLLAIIATGLFIFSLVAPYAANPQTFAVYSIWRDSRLLAIIAGGVFILLASIPLLYPKGRMMVFPILGSLLIAGFTMQLMIEHMREGMNWPGLLVLWCVFSGAGVVLLAEVAVARFFVSRPFSRKK